MPKKFSTKNLQVIKESAGSEPGVGVFEFTDDYSVFHYGKMPDQIPGKGEAIARMAAFNFDFLAKASIPTHFRGAPGANKMEFDLLRMLDPAEGEIESGTANYMIPLQVVFRNSLPAGASVYRRIESGSVTFEQLGLESAPVPGERLSRPIIEFTTKREEIDRFVTEDEAMRIAGLTPADLGRIKELVVAIDEVITERATECGLEHADGKVEFGMRDAGELVLVDNAGTPDENRFLFQGQHVGKQVMRDHYLALGVEREVQEWAAQRRPRSLWPEPEPLPPGFLDPLSDMYKALAERWIGEQIWGAPPLEEVCDTIRLLDSSAVRW